MDSSTAEIDHEYLPFLRVYKDGRVERLVGNGFVPPSIDSDGPVLSKDVTIDTETGLSARLFVPKNISKDKKLPLVIYFHGGSFMIESAFSPIFHNYVSSVVEEANVVAVSVDYRRAPEHPLPIAYNDSWEAIQWVASQSKGEGQEAWLTDYADFDKVFLVGDSAGGNIVHDMAMRAKEVVLPNDLKFQGIILAHPFFWGKDSIGYEGSDPRKRAMGDKMWTYACPSSPGLDDPRINPVAIGAPSLRNLGCTRVLVFVADKDALKFRGILYCETLKKSGWGGVVEVIETEGEKHIFHLYNPTCDKAISMMTSIASFLNQDTTPMQSL